MRAFARRPGPPKTLRTPRRPNPNRRRWPKCYTLRFPRRATNRQGVAAEVWGHFRGHSMRPNRPKPAWILAFRRSLGLFLPCQKASAGSRRSPENAPKPLSHGAFLFAGLRCGSLTAGALRGHSVGHRRGILGALGFQGGTARHGSPRHADRHRMP